MRSRRAMIGAGLTALVWVFHFLHRHHLGLWEMPYLSNNLMLHGWEEFPSYVGVPGLVLTRKVRFVLTFLVMAAECGLMGLLVFRADRRAAPAPQGSVPRLSWRQLLVLLGPCTAAYTALLLPRFLTGGILDRYLLFPEFVLLCATVLLYERKLDARLPALTWVLAALFVVANSMGMHDTFNMFRAQATLLSRLQLSGLDRTQLDGGEQFNGWTEIVLNGHVNDPRIRKPAGAYRPAPIISITDPCHSMYLELSPSVHARYVVSFDPNACGGPTGEQQSYTTWLGHPHTQTLYAVKGPE